MDHEPEDEIFGRGIAFDPEAGLGWKADPGQESAFHRMAESGRKKKELTLIDTETFFDLLMEQQEQM